MKKLLAIFLIMAMAVFGFAACAGETPSQSGGSLGGIINGGTNTDDDQTNEQPPAIEQPAPPSETGNEEQTPTPPVTEQPEDKEITAMYLTINGNKIEVTLDKNSAVDALIEILKQGDIIYTASDYGGFEKVGSLGHTLPANDTHITTQPGDVILYSSDQIVLFYGSNSWSYTRLGKINGYSVAELKDFLSAGKGDVQVTISLN